MSKLSSINNAEISSGQMAKLLFLFSLGSAVIILPTAIIAVARQDAWMSALLSIPCQYAALYIYLLLSERFPRLSLVQYSERLLGAWGGKLVALTYLFFFLIVGSFVLTNIADFVGLSVLPMTPQWFINVTFMLVVIYGVFLGLETLARTGEILFVWSLFINFIMVIVLLDQFDTERLEPLLYGGWNWPMKGLYPLLGFPIGECVFLSMVLPQVKQQERHKLKKHLMLSVLLFGLLNALLIFILLGVMGVQQAARSPFAIYDLAKTINIEEILVRVEVLVAVVWIGTVFTKLALCLYSLSLLTAQMLGLQVYRPLIVPYATIMIPISMILYRNTAHANFFSKHVWTAYSVSQGILLPLLLLIIAIITGKRDNTDGSLPAWKP